MMMMKMMMMMLITSLDWLYDLETSAYYLSPDEYRTKIFYCKTFWKCCKITGFFLIRNTFIKQMSSNQIKNKKHLRNSGRLSFKSKLEKSWFYSKQITNSVPKSAPHLKNSLKFD